MKNKEEEREGETFQLTEDDIKEMKEKLFSSPSPPRKKEEEEERKKPKKKERKEEKSDSFTIPINKELLVIAGVVFVGILLFLYFYHRWGTEEEEKQREQEIEQKPKQESFEETLRRRGLNVIWV